MKIRQLFSRLLHPGFWGGATGDASGSQRNEPTIGILPGHAGQGTADFRRLVLRDAPDRDDCEHSDCGL